MSDKILSNPIAVRHLAQRLRRRLAQGYPVGSRFLQILNAMSDHDLTRRYIYFEKFRGSVRVDRPDNISSLGKKLRKLLNSEEACDGSN